VCLKIAESLFGAGDDSGLLGNTLLSADNLLGGRLLSTDNLLGGRLLSTYFLGRALLGGNLLGRSSLLDALGGRGSWDSLLSDSLSSTWLSGGLWS
jgi:hypothetical protein